MKIGNLYIKQYIPIEREYANKNYLWCNFARADFQDAEFTKVVFDRCYFKICDFTGADFTNVVFKNCTFDYCTFNQVDLTEVKFVKCGFNNTTITERTADFDIVAFLVKSVQTPTTYSKALYLASKFNTLNHDKPIHLQVNGQIVDVVRKHNLICFAFENGDKIKYNINMFSLVRYTTNTETLELIRKMFKLYSKEEF